MKWKKMWVELALRKSSSQHFRFRTTAYTNSNYSWVAHTCTLETPHCEKEKKDTYWERFKMRESVCVLVVWEKERERERERRRERRREREKERERERKRESQRYNFVQERNIHGEINMEREREREREEKCVCICVCVCKRERGREKEEIVKFEVA